MVMAYFVTALLLPSFSAGATLYSESTEPSALMRRQSQAVQLNAGGQMVSEKKSTPEETDEVVSLCDYNFHAGSPTTNNCTTPSIQKLIELPSMCRSAAKISPLNKVNCSDLSCLGHPFVVATSDYFNVWPKGCFMDNSDPPKWFYNPVGYWPSAIQSGSTPICVEVEYINGTDGSNDCASDYYEKINVEYDCRSARICLGEPAYDQYRTLDATEQQHRPQGCHFGPDSIVKFNPVSAAPTTAVQGKPICKIKGDDNAVQNH